MKRGIARWIALSGILAAVASLNALAGETKKPVPAETPLPTDWSHRHLIFSQPRTPEQAARVQNDIRYRQQQARHLRSAATLRADKASESRWRFWRRHHRRYGRRHLHRDWEVSLGPGASVGAGRFPAKYSFSATEATCGHPGPGIIPDYVVYSTGPAGAGSQANIVAATNLYEPCDAPVPALFWAFNTGGVVLTSPVISLDGAQIAFTQTSAGVASLVLLKSNDFSGGSIESPATATAVLPADYPTCTAPCMTSFPLLANDSNSSVFYDYEGDTAWVGDDAGILHQFSGVFLGTPAEVTTGWPVTVSTVSGKTVLTSAVHVTDATYVGDQGGFLYRVDDSGNVTQSAQIDFGTGLTDGPILDLSAGSVFAVSSMVSSGSPNAGVVQFGSNFGVGAIPATTALIGTSSSTNPVYNGSFDHTYVVSPTSSGIFNVCGNPGGQATMYQISVASAQLGTVLTGPIISTSFPSICSPVTDVYNANLTGAGLPREWAFMSVRAAGTPTPCGGHACVMSFKITPWQPNTTYNVGQQILDSSFNIQVEEVPNAVSGASVPVWNPNGVFTTTPDGTAHWRNQGQLTVQTPPGWTPNNAYTGAFEIIDTHNNIEIVTNIPGGGTSGATEPDWPTAEGAITVDGTINWYNLGENPVAALAEAGGTSGIIIDNTANILGNSQVYFSTLSGGCDPGGTGGCAVQASQDGLN